MSSSERKLWVSMAVLCGVMVGMGCSPRKGYEGPSLPRDRVSLVRLTWPEDVITTERKVDGKKQPPFSKGLLVLPGNHKASMEYFFRDIECAAEGCTEKSYKGLCEVSFVTEAAKKYRIVLATEQRHDWREALVSFFVKNAADGELRQTGWCSKEISQSYRVRSVFSWR
ncbi:MAG: hypothetical protein IT291_04615 [Deltaproteobacteria bacterium]|nr:hypothetical protein [Deltaproteobacteria bacterium]